MRLELHHADSEKLLGGFDADSIDAAVTDPPYHLRSVRASQKSEWGAGATRQKGSDAGFMGKAWDGGDIAFRAEFWAQVLRVLKPGACLVAFGGTRTYHRLACAIEDAGFDVKDALMWHYNTGYPKSLNRGPLGTALKPATEIICLAQKPRIGTYDENLARFGTGFLNINDCRIPLPETDGLQAGTDGDYERLDTAETGWGFKRVPRAPGLGRWPSNITHDGSDEVVSMFPQSDGQLGDLDGQSENRQSSGIFGDMPAARDMPARGDSGSAARFHFCAKASTEERDTGLDALQETKGSDIVGREEGSAGINNARAGAGRTAAGRRNTHITVKPVALMRWLVRLVVPKGGTALDVFMGSGTTGVACICEDRGFVGIEREAEYFEICKARIADAQGPLFAART